MRALDLDWKTTEHTGQRDQRKGNVLFYAHFGRWSRFAIEELYQRPSQQGDAMPSLYVLRDADRVTDAQVRAGERSPVVSRSVDAQWLVDYALQLERQEARALKRKTTKTMRPQMTPARHMQDAAIERELSKLAKRWTSFRSSNPEGGGSPGEWIVERMDELETEKRRRAAGGEIDRSIPLQSR